MANDVLNNAKTVKLDEYYTYLSDIEKELKYYKDHFKGKTVLCNCDDPRVSNFFKFFALKFKDFGLKKLIATCYKHQDIDLFSDHQSEKAVYIVYEGTPEIDHIPAPEELEIKYLTGDGDFRSDECIELLKEADIVCTNPPFSLLREFINVILKHNKKFLIIGNSNAVHYADVFPHIVNNEIWIGYNHVKEFLQPDGNVKKFGNIVWFTNLDIPKHHEELILYKKYDPEEYTKYDNYDAIDVPSVADIPIDYDGIMGVPDGLLEILNPDQFEIIGLGCGDLAKKIGITRNYRGRTDLALFDKATGKHKCPYSRILVRKKK